MKAQVLLIFLLVSLGSKAQWRWYVQAEIGANKQELQQVVQLSEQQFNPVSFWRSTAGGELQVGYTFLKTLTLYSGLGYAHQNSSYSSSEWVLDSLNTYYVLNCNKVVSGELLTLPMGLDLKILSLHLGGGLQYRYRVQGNMQKTYSAVYPGSSTEVPLGVVSGPNTQAKFDMGYFAYAQYNLTKRIGIRASMYKGFRDLSNGLEVGAFHEWQDLFNQQSFALRNLQVNLGINFRFND
ncbi:MAG: hypothetical protein RLZZ301_381 [Bacteroidota bacterium]